MSKEKTKKERLTPLIKALRKASRELKMPISQAYFDKRFKRQKTRERQKKEAMKDDE